MKQLSFQFPMRSKQPRNAYVGNNSWATCRYTLQLKHCQNYQSSLEALKTPYLSISTFHGLFKYCQQQNYRHRVKFERKKSVLVGIVFYYSYCMSNDHVCIYMYLNFFLLFFALEKKNTSTTNENTIRS